MILGELSYVIQTLNTLARRVNIEFAYFSTILKIIGMAYIVEFGAQISRDAGEDSIAMKIELGGKVIIMVLAIPILLALMELIIKKYFREGETYEKKLHCYFYYIFTNIWKYSLC